MTLSTEVNISDHLNSMISALESCQDCVKIELWQGEELKRKRLTNEYVPTAVVKLPIGTVFQELLKGLGFHRVSGL